MEITLTLPWPPSMNRLWRMGKGNWYSTKVGEDYKEAVRLIFFQSRLAKFAKGDRLSVSVLAYPPNHHARDIDNLFKVLLDALQDAKVFPNDNQIDHLTISRASVKPGGEVHVWIKKLPSSC